MRDDDAEDGIRTAVGLWCADPAPSPVRRGGAISRKKAKYGPIASWEVSEVTDLKVVLFGETEVNPGDMKHGMKLAGCGDGQVVVVAELRNAWRLDPADGAWTSAWFEGRPDIKKRKTKVWTVRK